MLAISTVIGISALGYFMKQFENEAEFDENNKYNQNIPSKNINGCAEQYPWNFIENYKDVKLPVKSSNYIPNDINITEQAPYNDTQIENFSNISPLNSQPIMSPQNIEAKENNLPPYLINTNERPVQDFEVNNMVPFFRGSSTKQNMLGTDVPESNYVGDNYNPGNGRLTPHYNKLSNFTGCDELYLHKREVPNMFSPLERRDKNTIPGERPEMVRPELDRYTTSILHRPDKKPFEQIQVGSGINVDKKYPNDGQGFNSGLTSRVKPNNVNAYKLNSLPGRIAGTKYQYSNLPTALPGSGPSFKSTLNSKANNDHTIDPNIDSNIYGVPKNKGADLTHDATLERRPLTATPASTQLPTVYSPIILPSGTDIKSNTYYSFGQSVPLPNKET